MSGAGTRSAAPLRIAMWSGPRNISTAMMRAWENREDCAVSDEPLYAHYLAATGAEHPMREAVIAAGDSDWRRVAVALTEGPAPDGQPVWYQKHMAHHLLPGMMSPDDSRGWLGRLRNVLLIRHPAEVVASYLRSRDTVTPEDIGLPQQARLFDELAAAGEAPPVIDARDFLARPEAHLRALCDWLGIGFSERMLSWPPGPRDSDGVWAPHWYAKVWVSTGFAAPGPTVGPGDLDTRGRMVAEACLPHYQRLHERRLQV